MSKTCEYSCWQQQVSPLITFNVLLYELGPCAELLSECASRTGAVCANRRSFAPLAIAKIPSVILLMMSNRLS